MAQNDRRKRLAAAALAIAVGKTIEEASQDANVGRRTISRWLNDLRFNAKVERLRAKIDDRACGKLADAMVRAVVKTEGLMGAESEATQLAAARTILEYRLKVKDLMEMQRQMAEMKAQMLRLEAAYARASGDVQVKAVQEDAAKDDVPDPSVDVQATPEV